MRREEMKETKWEEIEDWMHKKEQRNRAGVLTPANIRDTVACQAQTVGSLMSLDFKAAAIRDSNCPASTAPSAPNPVSAKSFSDQT